MSRWTFALTAFTLGSYLSVVLLLFVFGVTIPLELRPVAFGLPFVPVIAFFGPLVFGWHPHVDYPFPQIRRKALALFAYGIPLFVAIWFYESRLGMSHYERVFVYVVGFLLMTTLTFGILPGYGGGFREGIHIWRIKNGLRENKPVRICRDCLSLLTPEDHRCWRCGMKYAWDRGYPP